MSTDKRNPDQELVDNMTSHHIVMKIMEAVDQAPGDGTPELAGVIMAASVLARLREASRPGTRIPLEYQQKKRFLKLCDTLFDKSLDFMRDVERAKREAGFDQEDPVVQAALASDPVLTVLPGKEPPQEN